jgi:hypothetical protein
VIKYRLNELISIMEAGDTADVPRVSSLLKKGDRHRAIALGTVDFRLPPEPVPVFQQAVRIVLLSLAEISMNTNSNVLNTLFSLGYGSAIGLGTGIVFWLVMMGGVSFLSRLIQYSGFIQ